jgi:stearoyl-CoA desaturase (delta-9 desaturase)
MKFGKNFFLIFLPLHVLALVGLYFAPTNLLALFVIWFLIGVIGNGVAAHRYFAHGQFRCSTPTKWVLGILATLGGIGPISYWMIQHKTHHIRADTENDPHDPNKGFLYTMYSWTFPQGSNEKQYMRERFAKRLAINISKDPFLAFFHKYHYTIIYSFCIILAVVNPVYLFLYGLAYCLDFIRLGLVNYFCHGSGYRNHQTEDKSTNNFWLGIFGMGFGWHNNHHASPGKLILSERWWEIDIEGYLGKGFSYL